VLITSTSQPSPPKTFVHKEDIVSIQAQDGHRVRKKIKSDGTEVDETVVVPANIDPLAQRMVQIVKRDGKDLLMANLLLQSRGLVEKARGRVKESLDRRAWDIVDKYMWGAGGVAALSPFPVIDLIAGSAISTKMIIDLASGSSRRPGRSQRGRCFADQNGSLCRYHSRWRPAGSRSGTHHEMDWLSFHRVLSQ